MKIRRYRRSAAAVLASFLFFSTPIALAATRDREAKDPAEKIVRVLKKLRSLFISTNGGDGILPPKP